MKNWPSYEPTLFDQAKLLLVATVSGSINPMTGSTRLGSAAHACMTQSVDDTIDLALFLNARRRF